MTQKWHYWGGKKNKKIKTPVPKMYVSVILCSLISLILFTKIKHSLI